MIAEVRLPVAKETADVRGALTFVVFLVPFHQEMDVSCVVAQWTARVLLLLVIFAVFLHVSIVEALERGAPSSTLHHEVVDHHLFRINLFLMTLTLCLTFLVLVLLAWLQRDALLLDGHSFLVGASCLLPAKLLILLAPAIVLRHLLAKKV